MQTKTHRQKALKIEKALAHCDVSSELDTKPHEQNSEGDHQATDYRQRYGYPDEESHHVSHPNLSYRLVQGGMMEPLIHTANYG